MQNKTGILALLVLATALVLAGSAAAQAEGEAAGEGGLFSSANAGLAVGAGLAIGLAAIGTGLAQKDIGAAAVGAIAEDAGFLGRGILMVAIPETLVIFGFVVAFLLYGKMA